jgi:hypothetical protein
MARRRSAQSRRSPLGVGHCVSSQHCVTIFNFLFSFRYSGGWANNAPHGLGVESLPHGRYYGEFAAGQRSGRGVFETFGSPRVCFSGLWAAGSMSGKGSVEVSHTFAFYFSSCSV